MKKLNYNLLLALLLLICTVFIFFQIFRFQTDQWQFWAFLGSAVIGIAASLALIAKPMVVAAREPSTTTSRENIVGQAKEVVSAPVFLKGDQSRNIKSLPQLIDGDLLLGGIAGHFEMIYRDTKGNLGNRDILLYALVERDGDLELDTFSRNNRFSSCRTYKASNIEKLRNVRTGEVIEDSISAYLRGLTV